MSLGRFVSERDFVARYLLPKLQQAAKVVGIGDVVDFYIEKPLDGIPDLTAELGGKGLFLVEAKFKKKVGRIERDIEPRDPEVISQAATYAVTGGFKFYATCNLKRIVLFQFNQSHAFRHGIARYYILHNFVLFFHCHTMKILKTTV